MNKIVSFSSFLVFLFCYNVGYTQANVNVEQKTDVLNSSEKVILDDNQQGAMLDKVNDVSINNSDVLYDENNDESLRIEVSEETRVKDPVLIEQRRKEKFLKVASPN